MQLNECAFHLTAEVYNILSFILVCYKHWLDTVRYRGNNLCSFIFTVINLINGKSKGKTQVFHATVYEKRSFFFIDYTGYLN